MQSMATPGLMLLLMLLSLATGSTPACACSIPVFRFALDRWSSELFRLEVPRDAPAESWSWAKPLQGSYEVNLEIVRSDGANAQLYFPDEDDPAYQGPLTTEFGKYLLDSPARSELIQRLLAGDSAVWVYVSAQPEPDQEILNRLQTRLRYFEKVGKLPEIDPNDPTSQLGPGPELALRFSVLSVHSADPREAWFVRMLAGPIAEELEPSEGFLAPVFGRGRVLGAFPVDQFDQTLIDEVGMYLAAPCSCQVKRQNPGWDLLLHVDWEKALDRIELQKNHTETPGSPEEQTQSPSLAGTTSLGERPSEGNEVETKVFGSEKAEPGDRKQTLGSESGLTRWMLLVSCLGMVAVASLLLLKRRGTT